MKERFPRAAFTGQAGLAAAKLAGEKGQADAARADLAWVADSAVESEYRTIAELRLAGLLLDEKKYDEALKQLDGVDGGEFQALAADRRGDILHGPGQGRGGEGGLREGAGRRWMPRSTTGASSKPSSTSSASTRRPSAASGAGSAK